MRFFRDIVWILERRASTAKPTGMVALPEPSDQRLEVPDERGGETMYRRRKSDFETAKKNVGHVTSTALWKGDADGEIPAAGFCYARRAGLHTGAYSQEH